LSPRGGGVAIERLDDRRDTGMSRHDSSTGRRGGRLPSSDPVEKAHAEIATRRSAVEHPHHDEIEADRRLLGQEPLEPAAMTDLDRTLARKAHPAGPEIDRPEKLGSRAAASPRHDDLRWKHGSWRRATVRGKRGV
jgi:hypothetical protein